jgi:tetratricopeptide (TPR) repeat protein
MPDFGILTLPLLGAVGVFVFSLLTGNDLTIDRIKVLSGVDTESHNEVILTRQLIDEMRNINESAEADLIGIDVGGSALDKSLTDFEEYFNLSTMVAGVRDLVGITPYHVVGEITPEQEGIRFTARTYAPGDNGRVSVVSVTGKVSNLKPMFHEAALQILTDISPYVVALYYFHEEMAQEDMSFEKTRQLLGRHIGESPRWRTYLAYDLIGRTHRVKAELDTKLSPENRQKELETAVEYLQAALVQAPDFFYSNLNLAMVYADLHQYDLADRYFAKTVLINRNDATTRLKWAEMLAEQGRTREAIFQYVAAVELAPHSADSRDHLAELYVKVKQFDAAKRQWQKAFQIDPMHKAFAERLHWLDAAMK